MRLPRLFMVIPALLAFLVPHASWAYLIDPSLKPAEKGVGVMQDESGRTFEFVLDEILFRPRRSVPMDKVKLEEFLHRTGGKVVGDDTVPDPPPNLQIKLDPQFKIPTLLVVHVDLSKVNPGALETDAVTFSSEEAAKLIALWAHEARQGSNVAPNFISRPTAMLFRTEERPIERGFENAFDRPEFGATGSKTNVCRAWQFVEAHGVARRPSVAILDGGFWLDSEGNSRTRDFSGHPTQYDFVENDYMAGGANSGCRDDWWGCQWHGTSSASAAAAAINNREGVVGTGGQVANLMLFRIGSGSGTSDSLSARAIRTALAWHADIISMSYSSGRGGIAGWGWDDAPYREAYRGGVTLLSAAPNRPVNVSDDNTKPCTVDRVICVGGLAAGANTADENSGFGDPVDIWAPFDGVSPVPNDGATPPEVESVSGNSYSTPFVAGVVAMMKAVNPALSPDDVLRILRSTAWRDSPDRKVTHYLNAFAAVKEAAGNRLPPDLLEPNNNYATATTPVRPPYENLTIHDSGDQDFFRFSVSDYSDLQADLDYLTELGSLTVSLIKETREGWAPTGSVAAQPTGLRFSAASLPPGTYLLRVTGSSPNLYNLQLLTTHRPLTPDRFENNDGPGLATDDITSLPFGTQEANLHTYTDPDYYRVTVSPSGGGVTFRIVSSEMPVNVDLYDGSGRILNSSTGGSLTVTDAGTYTFRVTGRERGRYRFEKRSPLADSLQQFLDLDQFLYLPPFLRKPGPDPGPDDFRPKLLQPELQQPRVPDRGSEFLK